MFAIYLRRPDFYRHIPRPPAWMNVTFNYERRAFVAAVDGKGKHWFSFARTRSLPGGDTTARRRP